jgi:serine/threonine protein kinase
LAEEAEERSTLQDLETSLSELLGESIPPPAPPPARFWTEEQVVRFRDRDYRIVARLGSGGVGTTFKVVEVDRSTKEDLGTYVAKVGHNTETGRRVLKAYILARSHLGRHAALSTIFEVARKWPENDFIALMTWIEGAPLGEFTGVFPLLAEEQQETSGEALALRWLRGMCEGLDVLHRNGLVHGDISPRNMIVSGSDLVLTDL